MKVLAGSVPDRLHDDIDFRIIDELIRIRREHPGGIFIPLSLSMSRSAIALREKEKPSLSSISDLFSSNVFATPVPMVPRPISPILIVFMVTPFSPDVGASNDAPYLLKDLFRMVRAPHKRA